MLNLQRDAIMIISTDRGQEQFDIQDRTNTKVEISFEFSNLKCAEMMATDLGTSIGSDE